MDYSFKGNIADDMIKMELGGRVDSANADAVKADIFEVADQAPNLPVELVSLIWNTFPARDSECCSSFANLTKSFAYSMSALRYTRFLI